MGVRYRVDPPSLPGRPDIVFPRAHVAVFCDGDFWHGRKLEERLKRLRAGHNASYWTQKIAANVERDKRNTARLTEEGWTVLRFWESDILTDTERVADQIRTVVKNAVSGFGKKPE